MNATDPLAGMTQAKWNSLAPAEREAIRDNSALHPKLIGLEDKRIRCYREGKARVFRVGISTGWRPVHLAVRGNASGSSDLISATEEIVGIHLD